MATTNRIYILISFVFSGIAAIFNIVSLSTEQWIDGKTLVTNANFSQEYNYVNYGLFQGTYKQYSPSPINYQMTVTCNLKKNVCALLCGKDSDERSSVLSDLFNNIIDSDFNMDNCPQVTRTTYYLKSFENVPIRANSLQGITVLRKNFINAGVWLCTVVFLILAALIGFLSSILALINTVTNPIQFFFSVGSLYLYNSFAVSFTILYVILWGAMYNITIIHNIGLYYTLIGIMDSDRMTYLGYSYWISFIPMLFYFASIAVLYYRDYLNERDPKQQRVNLEDSTDPNLYIY